MAHGKDGEYVLREMRRGHPDRGSRLAERPRRNLLHTGTPRDFDRLANAGEYVEACRDHFGVDGRRTAARYDGRDTYNHTATSFDERDFDWGRIMKLKNATTWDDAFLRAMISWICEEIDCPKRDVKFVTVGNRSRRAWRGCAYPESGEVLVRVIKTEFEFPKFSRRFGIKTEYRDRLEILVGVMAHELTHIRQRGDTLGWKGRRRHAVANGKRYRERECDKWERIILDAFRAQREALLTAWNAAIRPSTARPKVSAPARREAAARSKLAEWESKRKRAATAIKKYRAKVQYYDRKRLAAAKPSKGDK